MRFYTPAFSQDALILRYSVNVLVFSAKCYSRRLHFCQPETRTMLLFSVHKCLLLCPTLLFRLLSPLVFLQLAFGLKHYVEEPFSLVHKGLGIFCVRNKNINSALNFIASSKNFVTLLSPLMAKIPTRFAQHRFVHAILAGATVSWVYLWWKYWNTSITLLLFCVFN